MARPPLNRSMFRMPGMSRQPVGILASGPQIMQAANGSMNQNPFMMGANPARARQVSTAPTVQTPIMPTVQTPDPRMNAMDKSIADSLSVTDVEAMLGRQFSSAAAMTPPADPTTRSSLSIDAEDEDALTSVGDSINKKNAEALAAKKPAEGSDLAANLAGDLRKNINAYRTALDKAEPPSLNSPIAALGGKSYNKLVNDLISEGDTDIPDISDYKLSDFKDLAMEVTGRDREPGEVADEDRETAFWLNLMKAGLAIASGESSNALTNIAKGLSFGLEAYGKDMKDITQQERAANKEIAGIKFALLKDKKDSDIALRAAKIQALQTRVAIADKLNAQQLAEFDKKQARALEMLKVENDFVVQINSAKIKMETLKNDKEKFEQTLKATLAGQTPKFIRELAANNMVVATDPSKGIDFSDPNSYTTTAEGKALFEAYIESKGSVRLTDLMESANASSDLMMAQGFDFSHLPPEQAKKMAKQVTLAMGKVKLPTDAEAAAAAKIPYGRATGARTSDNNMIQYVLNNNIPGVSFYNIDGGEMSGEELAAHKSQKKAIRANAIPIGFIQFDTGTDPVDTGTGPARTIATPVVK